jgi:4-hydroxybenzoate polyprenyltransferase
VLLLPIWFWQGGLGRIRSEVAQRIGIVAADLPYDRDSVRQLEIEHGRGRRIVLVSQLHRRWVEPIAAHLGVIDTVHASDDQRPLDADSQHRLLVERYGEGGFDRLGPASDPPVDSTRQPASFGDLVGTIARRIGVVLRQPVVVWRPYIKALRLHQWLKNGLLFVPLVLAHKLFDPIAVGQVLLAFVAFGLTASSVYVLNDLVDLPDDRRHPTKSRRPFAAGLVPLSQGLAMAPLLLAASVLLAALTLPRAFLAVLLVYYATTLAYSFLIKRTMLFDVITLAGLFTLRIVAGSAALDIPRSFWLLAFSIFLFFSLALVKRYVELKEMGARAETRQRGRGYRAVDLETLSQFGIASGMMAVLVLALYIDSPVVKSLYRNPEMIWLLCPLMLYIVCRFWILARRGEMHDDPIVFAMRDWRSQMVLATGAILLLLSAIL